MCRELDNSVVAIALCGKAGFNVNVSFDCQLKIRYLMSPSSSANARKPPVLSQFWTPGYRCVLQGKRLNRKDRR